MNKVHSCVQLGKVSVGSCFEGGGRIRGGEDERGGEGRVVGVMCVIPLLVVNIYITMNEPSSHYIKMFFYEDVFNPSQYCFTYEQWPGVLLIGLVRDCVEKNQL